MRRIHQCILALFLLTTTASIAQLRDGELFQQQFRYHIQQSDGPVKVDGLLDEAAWQQAKLIDSFWVKFPNDTARPKHRTTVKMLYDEKYIYFGFTAFDSGKAFIQTLKRDNGHDGNDCVAVILDPTNQRTNGFFFVVNAFNAQSEDQLPLGEDNAWTWDNKWYSNTRRYSDRWVAEIAIPFKTLRYTSGKTTWGLNFLRVDPKENEYDVWTNVPINHPSHTLAYTGALSWDKEPPPAGSNMVFIPYVTGGLNQDQQNGKSTKATGNAGFDAKIALSSSLNLDLTANPDFSQVEVDQQVTNLTRFNIFFPERRTFFLENSDLFSNLGTPDVRPFYSRTIGLDKNLNRVPIIAGLRLTGNVSKKVRIGVLNMQTAKTDNAAAQNYSAVAINRRVLKRSVIRAYFLNHENFVSADEKQKDPLSAYGRNAGMEFNFVNLTGTWEGWASYNHSFKKNVDDKAGLITAGVSHNGRNFNAVMAVSNLGTNYYTDMGFVARAENYDAARDTVIRLGYKDLYAETGYRYYPKSKHVLLHHIELSNYVVFNPDNSLNENTTSLNYFLQFKSTANIFSELNNSHVKLLFPTSFTGATPLPKGNYDYTSFRIGYGTDFRKPLSFNVSAGAGGFYNGTVRSLRASVNLRQQPLLNVGLNAEYNKLSFPGSYGNAELFLLSSRVEVNFSTNLFWTTFLQYNTQRNNFNINSRFQYRFKPMSDIFLVYTDNYFTEPFFKNKNRAIVFKMNYWLNW